MSGKTIYIGGRGYAPLSVGGKGAGDGFGSERVVCWERPSPGGPYRGLNIS